jgi:fatty-acyl-CoA synthase
MLDHVAGAAAAYAYPLLLKHLLHTPLRHAPQQEIVYRDLVRHDYRTFAARVARLANGLVRLGVGPGDTVAVLDWDSHRYLECYFAVPGIGAVLHTVNVRLAPEQILYTINHAEDDVLLVHTDFLPLIESLGDRIERVRRIVVLTDDGAVPPTRLEVAAEYEALLAAAAPAFDFPDLDENTRATTFYTTGTTGAPKGVFFSHRQLVLLTLAAAAAFGTAPAQGRLHRGDVYMPITPMFHVHSWSLPFVATMLGLKQVYPGRYAPETLLGLIAREQVTFSHCVPTLLQMLLASPLSASTDLSRWKVVIGGSALPKGLARAAFDRGIDVFAGYGMSETGPILTLAQLTPEMVGLDATRQVEIRTRTGLPIPLVDLRVADPAMQDLPADGSSAGEVVVRAPWLTRGYLKDAAAGEALWRGGWLHTGDVGYIDPAGYLQITDRMKDVIKSGGEWISSLEIEDLISQLPGIAEVAVVGVPDATWGERAVALIVARGQPDEASIRLHLQAICDRGALSRWAIPARILFVESIAKTSVGKVDKKALRALLAAA